MGTTADKLTFLGETKAQIRTAIETKGVTVPPETTFREYATKIGEIQQGTTNTGNVTTSYTRPEDWLAMPTLTEGTQEIRGLVAVFDHPQNHIAFKCSGAYTVNWGDGTSNNYAAGVNAEHNYNYANFVGTETTKGYRQAILSVTPQAGSNLTAFDIEITHSANTNALTPHNWLQINISAPFMTSMYLRGNKARILEILDFVGNNSITSFISMFQAMAIKQIKNLRINAATPNSASVRYMFYGTTNLVEIPNTLNFAGLDIYYTFNGAKSLEYIPPLDCSGTTTLANTFQNCHNLKRLWFINTQNVTDWRSAFSGCNDLIEILGTNFSGATQLMQMCDQCFSLKRSPPGLDLIAGNLTGAFYYMFRTANQLLELGPFSDTFRPGHIGNMAQNAYSLQKVYAINMINANTVGAAFQNCYSLADFNGYNISYSIDFTNCNLSRTALIKIFNNLIVTTGQTITITGCRGVASLTQADRDIAINKGWNIAE